MNDRTPGESTGGTATRSSTPSQRANGTSVDLSFTTPGGRRHTVPARFGPDRQKIVKPPCRAREVTLGHEWKGIHVRLPAAEAVDPNEYQTLETEVGAALTIHRAYSDGPFQSLFPVPVGYDMDAAEPFVIYPEPRGEPATRLAHGVSTTDQRIIERDLVLAVRLLESLGLVHRGIVPAAVRWDGERTQLWDLGSTVRIGTPRTPWGTPPYASPEQRAGVGQADARDALWGAAQLMYQLVAGRQGSPDGPPADLDGYRSLTQTLGGAFEPRAEDRPTAGHLLGLLMPDADPHAMVTARTDPLEPHRRAYDTAVSRKRAAAGFGTERLAPDRTPLSSRDHRPPGGPPEDRARRRTWFTGGTGDRDRDRDGRGGR